MIWKQKIIDLYIFREVFYPFLIGVFLIGVIMLSGFLFELADLIIIKNVPISDVLELLLYQLPEIIVNTFPMAVLFATMYGLGRLNRENELTALRMGGISLYRLVIPLLLLGIIISGFSYFLNEEVVPWTNHRARNIIRLTILQQPQLNIQEDVFFEGPEGRLFYVREYDERASLLRNIVIFNTDRNDKYPEVITASSGSVEENIWQLQDGVIHSYDDQGNLELATDFNIMEIELARDIATLYGRQRTPREMSRDELRSEIRLFQDSGISVDSLLVDYHLKLAIPFIPLIFILIGAPLSLGNSDSKAAGIIMTIVIIFCYYFLQSIFRSFGRNNMIPPLLAAWMPNIIFISLGIVLISWKASWEKWLKKVLTGCLFMIFALSLLFPFFQVEASGDTRLRLQGEHIEYSDNKIELSGDQVSGQYQKLFMRADHLTVIKSDGDKETGEDMRIDFKSGKLSGCDYEESHYFFQAREATIYPGDYLVAKHVVFYELSGKLPLFYWPYLYISLKEETEGLIPEVGYSERRGWYVKGSYYYIAEGGYPGVLFLDYYSKTGLAGGIEHYFVREEDREGSIYFYKQQNKIDLPGLFNHEAGLNFINRQDDWQTELDIDYLSFDDYDFWQGSLEFLYSDDKRQQNFTVDADFEDKRYSESREKNQRELELDFSMQRYFSDIWELNLKHTRYFMQQPEKPVESMWSTRNFLKRSTSNSLFEILLEKFEPDLDTGSGKTFFRWPELNYVNYLPYNFEYLFSVGRYHEEDRQEKIDRLMNELVFNRTFRLIDGITFSTTQGLSHRLFTSSIENRGLLQQLGYRNRSRFNINLSTNSSLTTTYNYRDFLGEESPLSFEGLRKQNDIAGSYLYRRGPFDFRLSAGYDFLDKDFDPLKVNTGWQFTPRTRLRMEVDYNIEDQHFQDLVLRGRYRGDNLQLDAVSLYDLYQQNYHELDLEIAYRGEEWSLQTAILHDFIRPDKSEIALQGSYNKGKLEINSAVKYDISERLLAEWENQLIFEMEDLWYLELIHNYDYRDEFNDFDMLLKRNFHCRELWFSYNHADRRIGIQYHINLLPEHGFKFGLDEDRNFIFDLGIRELLER